MVANAHTAAFDLRTVFEENADSFVYFPVSVFWRASATRWPEGRRLLDPISLGPYADQFRCYLLRDEAPFPKEAVLIMQLASDEPNRSAAFPSSANQHGYRMHQFYIPGILWTLFVGKRIPLALKNLSMQHGDAVLAIAGRLNNVKIFDVYKNLARKLRSPGKPSEKPNKRTPRRGS